ncbi:unnamed protein product, partial [Laminaria digitata]
TLGALLEGVWGKGRIPRDADGRIVLDESPLCIKHIVRSTLTGSRASARESSALVAMEPTESAASSAVAPDEAPCLMYTAHVMGLWRAVPMHPNYVKMNGGSTILEPFEIAPFSATIRHWVGGSTDEMTLMYRATRDGFGSEAFTARCNEDSPNTVSVIRVSSGQGNDDDSVVGGYSLRPTGGGDGSQFLIHDQTFVFMLKDGTSATRKEASTPIKWHPHPGIVTKPNPDVQNDGAWFGGEDLVTNFDETAGVCTIQTGRNHFGVGEDSPFLALDGKVVVDFEVYCYSTPAPRTTTATSTTEPGDDCLTDA